MTESPEQPLERAVCVYCASSRLAHPEYRAAARRLGEVLAGQGVGIVYGGGAVGSMGALADGALSHGGRVIGILPRFMAELEWGHKGLTALKLVEDLRTRKRSEEHTSELQSRVDLVCRLLLEKKKKIR